MRQTVPCARGERNFGADDPFARQLGQMPGMMQQGHGVERRRDAEVPEVAGQFRAGDEWPFLHRQRLPISR